MENNVNFPSTEAPSVLTITSVEEKTATDGRLYKTVRVSHTPYKMVLDFATNEMIPVAGDSISSGFNVWERDSDTIGGRINPDYASYKEGVKKLGSIVKSFVKPYEIDDIMNDTIRTVNTASVVVVGDSTAPDWDLAVKAEFRNRGQELDFEATERISEANVVQDLQAQRAKEAKADAAL